MLKVAKVTPQVWITTIGEPFLRIVSFLLDPRMGPCRRCGFEVCPRLQGEMTDVQDLQKALACRETGRQFGCARV
jgi:hypothetical protein